LKSAVRHDNPVLLMRTQSLYFTHGEVPDGDYTIPFGVADVKAFRR